MATPARPDRRRVITALATAAVLAALAWWLPRLRRALIFDITWWDAAPTDPVELPAGDGPGLARAARTRVVLIDGLAADVAAGLRAWNQVCARGVAMRVDVGFPTVSLPVEVALWTGLTQQQTGVVSRGGGRGKVYGRPLVPPLDRRGIPAQVAGSVALAEDHGWIARSLGFALTLPAAQPGEPALDAELDAWRPRFAVEAATAVASDAALVFVHVLRVDTAGHRHGIGHGYIQAAVSADALLGQLVAAAPDARWFVLSDHGHLAAGGHGGTERALRQVRGCIAGPGIAAGTAELVHVVDVARALADSTGATLDPASRGRPLGAAIAAPLAPDQAVPAVPLSRSAIGALVLAIGVALAVWGARRWWLAPWWFVAACVAVLVVRGEPTLSTAMTYRGDGRLLYTAWLVTLPLAAAATYAGLARAPLARVIAAQLGLPVLATAAAMAAAGAWPVVFGAELAPVTPRVTAWMLALVLMVSHGAAAVALGVLARLARSASGRREPPAPSRTAP